MAENSNNNMFFQELIFLDKVLKSANEFFDFIYPMLLNKGYVRASFLSAIKARESSYPTALPTAPFIVALPHTDIEHIIRPFIAVTRVKGTVPWHEMANNDHILDVSFIFLLGFTEKDGHIDLLQTLMTCFSESNFLQQLYDVETCEQFIQLLNTKIKL